MVKSLKVEGKEEFWNNRFGLLANQIAASAPKGHVTFRGQIGVVRMRREQLAGVFL